MGVLHGFCAHANETIEGHFAEVRILVHPDVQGVYVRTSSPYGLRHVVPLGWVASMGREWPLGFGRCRKSVIVRHTILEDPYMKLMGPHGAFALDAGGVLETFKEDVSTCTFGNHAAVHCIERDRQREHISSWSPLSVPYP